MPSRSTRREMMKRQVHFVSFMILLGELRWIYGPRLRSSMGWVRRVRRLQGVPVGITFEVLDEVCRRYLGEPLQQLSYVRLSGKAEADVGPFEEHRLSLHRSVGTYRLLLQPKRGRPWSVIYKNDIRPDDLS